MPPPRPGATPAGTAGCAGGTYERNRRAVVRRGRSAGRGGHLSPAGTGTGVRVGNRAAVGRFRALARLAGLPRRGGRRPSGPARRPTSPGSWSAFPTDRAVARRRHVPTAGGQGSSAVDRGGPVSYTHLRAHETRHDLVCRLL